MRIGHLPAVIRFRINGFSVVGKYMFGAMPSKGRPARDATLTRRQHRQSTHTAGCGPPGKASTRAAGTGRTRPQHRRSDWPSTNSCADRRHRRPATSWLTTGQAAVKPARRPSTHAAGLAPNSPPTKLPSRTCKSGSFSSFRTVFPARERRGRIRGTIYLRKRGARIGAVGEPASKTVQKSGFLPLFRLRFGSFATVPQTAAGRGLLRHGARGPSIPKRLNSWRRARRNYRRREHRLCA